LQEVVDPVLAERTEAQIVIEQWRKHYNMVRPHLSLGYRPPAPQTLNPFPSPLNQAVPMQ
jgi:putative transposase